MIKKAKLEFGKLSFLRQFQEKFEEQFCPYRNGKRCGSWCPLFYINQIETDQIGPMGTFVQIELQLCRQGYFFEQKDFEILE